MIKNEYLKNIVNDLTRKINHLKDQKNESELLETLEVLVNNLGVRNVTANALHLHRNTLIYRIKIVIIIG